MNSKPIASLSLDLDDQWSYMKIHGDNGWEEHPSYLDIFIPYILKVLDELELKITFFIVGQDAIGKNKNYLKQIVDKGHEIGNHSFHHESWLKDYSRDDLRKEIDIAELAILDATGQKPKGFRGPGFSWSLDLLEVLYEKGYTFDASTLPTFIGPLARLYYFWKSNLTKEERKGRKELFGSFKDGLRPVRPYHFNLAESGQILEIPVGTMPFFRVPYHMSYLLYISGYSMLLMKFYLQFAMLMCKISRTSPSFLLHPLDLISGDQIPQLKFFPGMNIPSERKIEVFRYVIQVLKKHYQLLPMNTHASLLVNERLHFRNVL